MKEEVVIAGSMVLFVIVCAGILEYFAITELSGKNIPIVLGVLALVVVVSIGAAWKALRG